MQDKIDNKFEHFSTLDLILWLWPNTNSRLDFTFCDCQGWRQGLPEAAVGKVKQSSKELVHE